MLVRTTRAGQYKPSDPALVSRCGRCCVLGYADFGFWPLWIRADRPKIQLMADNSFTIPRNWWGKLIGGVLGMLKGGFASLVVGILIGHMVDRLIAGHYSKERLRRLFFNALFACLGHINKADGRVSEAEIRSAKELMRRLQLSEPERAAAIEAFNHGKQAAFDMEGELQEFLRFSRTRPDLRQMFLEVLLDGASSDGDISPPEQAVLQRAARALQIPPAMLQAMFNAFVNARARNAGTSGSSTPSQSQDLAVLGLDARASDQDVKRAYRKLVRQYHPDRLVSQGLPEEMMERAKARVRDINLAYDRLKQARGFK